MTGFPLALLLLPVAAPGPAWTQIYQPGWTSHSVRQHPDAGPVEVLKRTVAGVACFAGTTLVDLPRAALLEVATDIPGSVHWSTAGVKEAETFARSANGLDFYQYLALPAWTLSSDRFWFLHGVVEQSPTVSIFRWDRLEGGGPYATRYEAVLEAHPGAVEPPVNAGGWVFAEDSGLTRITYYICSDVGGAIPIQVQTLATTRTLPDNVGDLVREARQRTERAASGG
ncbi:MAG: hypothetical protein JXB39_07865 [Deltaproteobacteria bacterium]|nr:hypothetical protein [Deltaproteobacteria bacterium]